MTAPPTGTVTFVFTDVEGSTVMWENYPTQMKTAMNRHDEIVRSAVEAHGGYVFKMVGDACCAAFAYPREALRAALEAQRALFSEEWVRPITLKVRTALHTGMPEEERDGDYFGPAVNRVARLLSAAHGGQVLLSATTWGLVHEHPELVDEQAQLVNLGEHRLKDLTYPEHVFQLTVPDLPERFPPLRTRESPGELADERYRIKDFLGSGGMAKVYLAYDENLRRDVAIKVLLQRYAGDEEFVERFEREAYNAASLSHPNIVQVYDRGETKDGTYYMVMEHMPGGTLKDLILKKAPLPPREAIALTLQIAEALQAAHERGVIHRDIKPQNVLLDDRGNAKVADFGLARAADATALTRTGAVLGTPHYVAPELSEGQPATPRSDLYGLGVVLYEMLTGELPYDAETPMRVLSKQLGGQLRPPREINPDVPERLNAVATRLLASDPEDRYRDATELVSELQQLWRSLERGAEQLVPGGSATERDDLADTIANDAMPSTVRVPNLTGQDAFRASGTLANAGLTLGDQNEVPSETARGGEIIEQTPRAGTELAPGSLVNVTVSAGRQTASVPQTAPSDTASERLLLQGEQPSTRSLPGQLVPTDFLSYVVLACVLVLAVLWARIRVSPSLTGALPPFVFVLLVSMSLFYLPAFLLAHRAERWYVALGRSILVGWLAYGLYLFIIIVGGVSIPLSRVMSEIGVIGIICAVVGLAACGVSSLRRTTKPNLVLGIIVSAVAGYISAIWILN
jgi:serine/threonine protein kinase/class 3 adenylate cyclase